MARTKQTARKSTGGKAPRRQAGHNYESNALSVDTLWPLQEGPAPMTTQQQEQVLEEDRYRDLFANHRSSSELSDPHLLLHDLFANNASYVYQEEDPDEILVPKILTSQRVLGRRESPCFASRDLFRTNWAKFTNGILDGLNWNNVFAAGGSVLANITAHQDPEHFASSDIDLFLYGFDTDEQANKKLEHIFEVVRKHSKTTQIVRSFRAVTILGAFPDYRHVQIILKLYKSPAEVLLGFDVDCCTVGFDGTTVWAMDRSVRAVSKGYNLVNMSRRSLSYETRLRKYSKRGYAVAVPHLDKAQVDVELFQRSAADVQGLAKLLIYEYYDRNPNMWGTSYGVRSYSMHKIIPRRFMRVESRSMNMNQDNIDIVRDITGEEDSDYAEFIPWGPAWYSNTIMDMVNYKDRASAFGGRQTKKQILSGGKKEKLEPTHHHSYVTGIQGVIEGRSSNFWCRYCKQNKYVARIQADEEEGEPLEQSEDGKDVCGPLHWVNENQAMQDLDKGFRRSFAGSFQPVLQENWTEGVYAAGYQPRDSPHPLVTSQVQQQQQAATLSFGSPARLITTSSPSGGLFVGAGGGQRFESQNQLFRHMRENPSPSHQAATSGSLSPFGNDIDAFNGKPSVDIFAQNVTAFGGGTLPFWATTVSDTPTKSTVVRNLNSPTVAHQKPASSPSSNQPTSYQQNSWSGNNINTTSGISPVSKPVRTVAPDWWSLFGKGTGSSLSEMSYVSQALLLVAALYRKGAITQQAKGSLKDLILQGDALVKSVVEAFFIDQDLSEVADSFTRVCAISDSKIC